jgi:hypothetical protein
VRRAVAIIGCLLPALATARSAATHELIDRTWHHTTAIDRCHLRLEPDTPGERARLLEVAAARFGTGAKIELTPLGDRVARIVGPIPFEGERPADKYEATAIAKQFVTEHADILGIADEIEQLRLAGTPDRTGGGWTITGSVFRTVEGLAMSAGITVAVDRRGAIARLAITSDMLPVFTLCDAPTLDPNGSEVRRKILATRLDNDDGPINAKDIAEATTRVVRIADSEVQRVLAIHVTRHGSSWMFLVDGETGDILRVDEMFGALVDYP